MRGSANNRNGREDFCIDKEARHIIQSKILKNAINKEHQPYYPF